jgi:molybdopterin-guanine dinucleotide biosynthesis protein A
MNKEMIQYLVEYKSDKPIIFCEAAGYHQPLIGLYSNKILKEVEKFILNNESTNKSFHQFLKNVDVEIIHPEKLLFYKDEIFYNMNRLEDYENLKLKFDQY